MEPHDRWNYPALGYLLAQMGRKEEARQIVNELTREHEKGKPVCYSVALVMTGLGEKDEALTWLERSAAAGESSIAFLGVEKRFESLHTEQRFAALLKSRGSRQQVSS